MRTVGAFAIVLLVISAVPACSGSGGTPNVSVSLNSYCKEVAEVACHNMFHCCTGKQIEEYLGVTISTEQGECRQDVELICEDELAAEMWAAEKGTVILLEEEATACLEARLLAGECIQHVSEIPWMRLCEGYPFFSGTRQPGSDCLYPFECQDGSYCAENRKCKAFPKVNEPCAWICDVGLFCNRDDLCEAYKAEGEDCTNRNACAEDLYCPPGHCQNDNTCYNDDECRWDGRCELSDDLCMNDNQCPVGEKCLNTCMGVRKCEVMKALDEECDPDHHCGQGLECIPGLCEGTKHDQTCFSDEGCVKTCADSLDSCVDQDDCPGRCSISQETCEDDIDCQGTDTCENRENCIDRGCFGKPFCGEDYYVIDYCTDPMNP